MSTVLLPASLIRALRQDKEGWRDHALCAEVGGDVWFPETSESPKVAKRICGRCDVQAECLESALANDDRFGVWGGTSVRERHKMRKPGTVKRHERWLSEDEITSIRKLIAAGLRDAEISRRTGRSEASVRRIRTESSATQQDQKGAA